MKRDVLYNYLVGKNRAVSKQSAKDTDMDSQVNKSGKFQNKSKKCLTLLAIVQARISLFSVCNSGGLSHLLARGS